MRRGVQLLIVALLVAAGPACDSVSPVAPEGTVLSVSISPTFIEVNGSAKVTVVARESSGQPVNEGVEVFFATTLGTIDEMAKTDERGVAEATLQGDGRTGEAVITVTSGAAAAVVSDPIQIGAVAALISLQVTPSVVLEDGGILELLALVRDDRGALFEGAIVNFGAEFGILASAGGGISTDQNGEARDTLEVTPADVASAGDSFEVTATTAGKQTTTGGAVITAGLSATFTVTVTRLEPIASFNYTLQGNRTVTFTNASSGAEPLKFVWNFSGQGASTERNPTFQFPNTGSKTVTLTVTNDFGQDNAVATFVLTD